MASRVGVAMKVAKAAREEVRVAVDAVETWVAGMVARVAAKAVAARMAARAAGFAGRVAMAVRAAKAVTAVRAMGLRLSSRHRMRLQKRMWRRKCRRVSNCSQSHRAE